MTAVQERVRELRKGQGISQAELGERIGKGRLAITKLEQGQRSISVEEAYALAAALGVSITELLGETPEPHEEEGVELRFEVTVRLLPSRGTPTEEPTTQLARMAEKYPEIQRLLEADPTLVERLEKANEKQSAIIGASKRGEKVARVPSKQKLTSKTTRKATKR